MQIQNNTILSLGLLLLIYASTNAQAPAVDPIPYFRSGEPPHIPCLTPDQQAAINAKIDSQRTMLIEQGLLPVMPDNRATQLFEFPLRRLGHGLLDYCHQFFTFDTFVPADIADRFQNVFPGHGQIYLCCSVIDFKLHMVGFFL